MVELVTALLVAPLWGVRGGDRWWYAGTANAAHQGGTLQNVGRDDYYLSKSVGRNNASWPIAAKSLYVDQSGTYPNDSSYWINTSGAVDRLYTASLRCLHQP